MPTQVAMPSRKFPSRKFSFGLWMLLSGLGMRTDTAGKPSAVMNGLMGCDPPVVRISKGGVPSARVKA